MSNKDLPIAKELYEADLSLLDRYQSFSSELLRIALLGIGASGYLAEKLNPRGNSPATLCLLLSIAFWALASATALAHRYYSSDGVFYHMQHIRLLDEQRKEEASGIRNNLYRKSGLFLRYSAIFTALGALLFGVTLCLLVMPPTVSAK